MEARFTVTVKSPLDIQSLSKHVSQKLIGRNVIKVDQIDKYWTVKVFILAFQIQRSNFY